LVASWISVPCLAQAPAAADDEADVDKQELAVQAVARRAGLQPFQATRSRHFLAIGDASDRFRSLTLRDCELIAADYLDHYRSREFAVALPNRRLTVVTLADDRSFARYSGNPGFRMVLKGIDPIPAVLGYYNQETECLVIFDQRTLGPDLAPRPGLGNLRTLAHELTHQLTYNTGLLDCQGDVPACIIEGLAMYGEVRKSSGRTPPGQHNLMRIRDLAAVQRRRIPWIPIVRLIEDDMMVRSATSHERLLAYAESWLLIDFLMKDRSRLPAFRAYLDAIRRRRDSETRLDDARAYLGNLDQLNVDLRRYSIRLLKSS